MALIGGLRLIAGLTFLGAIIAMCLWLLSRLFPGSSNMSQHTRENAVNTTFQPRKAAGQLEHNQIGKSGVLKDYSSENNDEYKNERMPR